MDKVTCFLIVFSTFTAAVVANIEDCDFYDTVDLTGLEEENGSYIYKNVKIPKNKTGIYNYTTALFSGKKPVEDHRRGCLCQVKKCVLFCCEPAHNLPNAYMNIIDENKIVLPVDALKEHVIQTKFKISCDHFFEDAIDNDFAIKEDGNLTCDNLMREYSKEEYCLVPVKINDTYYELRHPKILHDIQKQTKITFSSILKSASIFCMIMIISVYIYLPKFRTVYSNCCLCYFICLTISFILIWYENIFRDRLEDKSCYLVGYSGYFTVMAMFLWLVVINFDLWRKIIKRENSSNEMFLKYNIFVWSLAATLVAITGTIEYLTLGDKENPWRPGVEYYYCWINTETWAAMLYYFGPILIMLIINTLLCVIAAKHIYAENKKIRKMWKTFDSQTTMTNQANFGMFFRMFAISGIIWAFELIAYIFQSDKTKKNVEEPLMRKIFPKGKDDETVIDLITCSSGILLFFVTIWKKDVLEMICKRMKPDDKKTNQSTFSTSSEVEIPLSSISGVKTESSDTKLL